MEGLIDIKISADWFQKQQPIPLPPSQIPFVRRGKEKLKYKSERKRIDRSSNNKIRSVNILLSSRSEKIAPSKPLCTTDVETKAF